MRIRFRILCNLRVPIFDPKWTRNGPNLPQHHPKRFRFFSNILFVIIYLYNNTGSSLKGRCWGGNCLKRPIYGKKYGKICNRIIRPNLFNMVKYVLNTIQRIIKIRIRRMTHPSFKTLAKNSVYAPYARVPD